MHIIITLSYLLLPTSKFQLSSILLSSLATNGRELINHLFWNSFSKVPILWCFIVKSSQTTRNEPLEYTNNATKWWFIPHALEQMALCTASDSHLCTTSKSGWCATISETYNYFNHNKRSSFKSLSKFSHSFMHLHSSTCINLVTRETICVNFSVYFIGVSCDRI